MLLPGYDSLLDYKLCCSSQMYLLMICKQSSKCFLTKSDVVPDNDTKSVLMALIYVVDSEENSAACKFHIYKKIV